MNTNFLKDVTDRIVKTFLQTFVASLGAGQIWNVSADHAALLAAGSAVLSGVTSAAAGLKSGGATASLLGVLPKFNTKSPLEKQLVVIGGDAMVEIIKAAQEQFQGKPAIDPPPVPEMATPLPDLLGGTQPQ